VLDDLGLTPCVILPMLTPAESVSPYAQPVSPAIGLYAFFGVICVNPDSCRYLRHHLRISSLNA
jgi:hypothetical protein